MNDLVNSSFSAQSLDDEKRLELLKEWLPALVVIGLVLWSLSQSFVTWAENLEHRHRRGELLAAYKRRKSWKKSDIQPLQSLDVNKAAQSRMRRLAGIGRPVVKPHEPLEVTIAAKLNSIGVLFDDGASATQRRQALGLWPWWRHHVEALYRGEHAIAREQRVRDPSGYAERKIADALLMSPAAVHAACGEIRRLRLKDAESANFPPMTLADYWNWIEKGQLPDHYFE